jgi:hypothetical protein
VDLLCFVLFFSLTCLNCQPYCECVHYTLLNCPRRIQHINLRLTDQISQATVEVLDDLEQFEEEKNMLFELGQVPKGIDSGQASTLSIFSTAVQKSLTICCNFAQHLVLSQPNLLSRTPCATMFAFSN